MASVVCSGQGRSRRGYSRVGQHHVGPHMSAPSSAHCLSEMWEASESIMSRSSCWLSERSVGSLDTCKRKPKGPTGWNRIHVRARVSRELNQARAQASGWVLGLTPGTTAAGDEQILCSPPLAKANTMGRGS